ncbi:relaxin receptor 2-like [Pomacea canaliculata]|uniref:relaxin receptor 2-like n=1 Tax=Pomacea canaliculata TaxID=400727 RepID=UPI000D727BBE|nr:relaxin receptor 2-like [Pomacea canaliculata]XP_025099533.1 relaxin receptor 2-like [Pomacea canaliculata]
MSGHPYCACVVVMVAAAAAVVIACVYVVTAEKDEELFPPDCPIGMFPCNNPRVCINSSLLCNKVFDCEDKSDEGCICDTFHDDYIHSVLQKRPDADREKEDPACSLQDVPESCECKNKTNIYCRNTFHLVTRRFPDGVTVLDLSGSNLPIIRINDVGNLPLLVELLIMHSRVEVIEDGALAGCPSLQELHLTENLLTTVPGKAFLPDNKLTFLSLKNNLITTLSSSDLASFPRLRRLDLHANRIFHISDKAFSMMPNLIELDLSENKLVEIKASFFQDLDNLHTLILNRNGITTVQAGAFSALRRLMTLGLDGNYIHHIQNGMFSGLGNLVILLLANNGIRRIDEEAFKPLVNATSVDLVGNSLRNLSNKTFIHMRQLYYIYFDKFYQCVYAQHAVECEPRGDGISSRENLLESLILRVCVWLVAILSCAGNVVVFLGRFVLREDNQIHSFFIKNLSLADMLMGVYLLVIGAKDLEFRGQYLLRDEEWRNSWECDVCGVLSTLSTEMSVLTLFIITLDRYLSITYPLSFRKRGLKAAYCVMLGTWSVCVLLALLPVLGLNYFGTSFYRDNGVCIPLHLHEPRAKGWEYSSFLFLGINLVSFAFIAYAYAAMFWSIHKSAIPLRTSRESRERCLVKRFFFIVLTDFLCWIPIIIIKVVALAGVSVSRELYAWVIVFILPVNSALNPLLYTLTTKLFKQKLLSTFTSVVWRPSTVKDGSMSTRTSLRVNSYLLRNPINEAELELLRRHGCYKNGSNRERETSLTPVASSPASCHFLYSGCSPSHACADINGRGPTTSDYSVL